MNATPIKISDSRTDEFHWIEIVRRQVDSLRFGVVQIVVHDSRVTQIDKTERVRLEKARAETAQ